MIALLVSLAVVGVVGGFIGIHFANSERRAKTGGAVQGNLRFRRAK